LHKLPTRGQVIIQLAQICFSFPLESASSHPHSINPNLLLFALLLVDWPLLSTLKHMNVKTDKLPQNKTKIDKIATTK
jgi:hypothetical protein